MTGRLTWGALPPEVISRIFWCTDLQLVDRLRCEAVCQTWQAVLAQNPNEIHLTSVWDIVVTLEPGRGVWQNSSQPGMRIRGIHKAVPTSGDAYIVFREWCKLKRHLLRRVQLIGVHPKFWQLQDMFRIFQAPHLQRPPVLEVSLQSGLSILLTCWGLLRNTLAVLDLQLTVNEGHNFARAATVLRSLQALRKLCLTECAVRSYDLRGCSQLTELVISWRCRKPDYILMPNGNTVQLQHLIIKAAENNIDGTFHNLQLATQLSHLDIYFAHDPQLNCNDLASLRSLTLGKCSMCTFDLSSYTQLTHVHIWDCQKTAQEVRLPAGSTVQLRALELTGHPDDVYKLCSLGDATQLTCLDLFDMYPGGSDVWPESMPSLQDLTANRIPLAPPQQLCGYTNLRLLELGCFVRRAETDIKILARLPDCFAHMTKLKKLEILSIQDSLDYFPEVVLQLKHLCALHLCGNRFDKTGLSAEIMHFTEFSALTRLDLRLSSQSHHPQWRSTEFVSSSSTRQLEALDDLLATGVLHF